MHSAELLARTTADGLKKAISNNTDAITAEAPTRAAAQSRNFMKLEQQQMVFKTQLFQQYSRNNSRNPLARTADGLKTQLFPIIRMQ
jgi:light-regulated signal transduction histidine kinase (bacteriophytochrome)